MTYDINDGWIHGKLPGPGGTMIPVKHFPQPPFTALTDKPNLVLHTTETDVYLNSLRYPSQFQVGEEFIGQHKPLWARGDASKSQDAAAMQIEIVGRSQIQVWLPKAPSLEPLVALVAFLHAEGIIRTGLARPKDWPLYVDYRGSSVPASDGYYRRHEGLWPGTAGVYGHLELPGDDHWDPGGFDYPRFFDMVRDVLGGDELTPEQEKTLKDAEAFLDALRKPLRPGAEKATPKGAGERVAKTVLIVERAQENA